MDEDTASRFVSSLVKSIQALCNGYIDFSTSIEVIGHIHLNIDHNKKLDYVLTEEVSKSVSEGATVFASHSYHSQPPPSVSAKGSSDSSNRHRQKVTGRDDSDHLGLTSLPHEVPNSSKSDSQSHNSNRVSDTGSFHSGSASSSRDSEIKQRNSPCQGQDSIDSRRRSAPTTQGNPSPAAKRSRPNDFGSRQTEQDSSFDVIEIKEEPEEEPAVYFGDNSSHLGAGQDIQAPDFSNVVMESLDRVGQVEGTQLVGSGGSGDGMQMQQPPFPVMLHSNAGMSSPAGPVPGPSDPQTAASTSGEELSSISRPSISGASPTSFSSSWGIKTNFSPFNPSLMSRMHHPAFPPLSRSMWMGSMGSYRPRPRMQYTPSQISAAILDVEMGKSISKSAKDNGVPFTSLYRKVKARSAQQSGDKHREPVDSSQPFGESLPTVDSLCGETAQPDEEPVSEEKDLSAEELFSSEKPLSLGDSILTKDSGSP